MLSRCVTLSNSASRAWYLIANFIKLDAYIFLVGSSGSTCTTLCFLYVIWEFPRFLKHVKAEGADPVVVVRLATFYNLNVSEAVCDIEQD